METLTQPTLLLKPFAENGDKNAIPLNNETISQPQRADLTVGFPPITSKDPADGGLPPERKDFNALGYLTTTYDYFYQAGGTFTFNSTISNAIGGYPLGARLWYTNSDGVSCILWSTIANNTNDFTQNSSVIGETGSGKPWEVENFRGINSRGILFDCKWADHIINDISWLRADTFSWQSGAIYVAAYNHLVDDIDGKTATSETIGGTTVYFYIADDGHKIAGPDQETAIQNIYNTTGVAWYYILDETNQRFKLPRTKFGFTGLRDSVGNYVEAGLPNITGGTSWFLMNNNTSSSGAFSTSVDVSSGVQGSGSASRPRSLEFDASKSNSIYGNSSTVQPPTTQMYLYFYIGNYNQSATEQTAGLNTELFNDKLDLDAGNATSNTKQTIDGWGKPDYTAAVDIKSYNSSSNQYSAPINGWISISKNINASFYINGINFTAPSSQNYSGDNCIIPVKKGTTYYNTGTVAIANFYPCLGG